MEQSKTINLKKLMNAGKAKEMTGSIPQPEDCTEKPKWRMKM